MASRDELIKQAKAKHEREQLIAQASSKWQAENAPEAEAPANVPESVETGSRSMLEGMTLGMSEPALSGANAVIGNLIDSGFDSDDLKSFLSNAVDSERIKRGFNEDVGRRRKLEAEHPVIATGSEIAGAVIPSLISGGTSLGASGVKSGATIASKLGSMAGKAVEAIPGAKGLLEAENILGRAARVGKAGVEGAAVAGGSEGVKRLVESPTGFIQDGDEQADLGDIAALGGKFGAGMRAIPELAGMVSGGAKGMLSALGGVKPQTIDKYLDNVDQIKSAKSIPDAKAIVDDAIAKVQDAVAGQKGDFVDEVIGAVGTRSRRKSSKAVVKPMKS